MNTQYIYGSLLLKRMKQATKTLFWSCLYMNGKEETEEKINRKISYSVRKVSYFRWKTRKTNKNTRRHMLLWCHLSTLSLSKIYQYIVLVDCLCCVCVCVCSTFVMCDVVFITIFFVSDIFPIFQAFISISWVIFHFPLLLYIFLFFFSSSSFSKLLIKWGKKLLNKKDHVKWF